MTDGPSARSFRSARAAGGGDQTERPPIPTYFSHSYRPGDREVNLHFHKLFWEQGFAFTVDPKSGRLALAQLELMMQRSACFVAVAPYRPEQEQFKTSPFVVYEYGLALQAQKPRFVFVESGVAGRFFEESHRCVFRRDDLPDDAHTDLHRWIEQLRDMSRPYIRSTDRTLGSVGLVLPQSGVYTQARAAIRDLLRNAGYAVEEVSYEPADAFELVLQADRHDFIVIDVGAPEIPVWLHPLLSGRFIPMVRLVQRDHVRDAEALLAPVLGGHAIRSVANQDEPMLPFSTVEELVLQLEAEIDKLQGPRRQFRTLSEGLGYFHSLGRFIDGSIFVSNAGPENELARDLGRLLDINNIPFFHYVYKNTIEIGSDWSARLREKLASSRLFVPLVTRAYWNSPWCRDEFEIASELRAQGQLHVYPYFLEDPAQCGGPLGYTQGRVLAGLARDEQLHRIVGDVDNFLTEPPPAPSPKRTAWYADPEPAVDVAVITVLAEEYESVLRHLNERRSAPGTAEHPNRYSWELGQISSPAGQRTYRVVLGLAGRQGTSGGLLVVRDTIEAFDPRYVLLVGIAGGLGAVEKGDVVVSDQIYGYEYGKIDGGFRPRPNWVYTTDTAVTTAATTMHVRHPRWYAGLVRDTGLVPSPPRIHVAPVASGNKVVDDVSDPSFRAVLQFWPKLRAVEMEGLGAAEAIHEARERQRAVNFAMVRGISDVPRAAPSAGDASSQTAERDAWKTVAADAAAELAVQLIRLAWPHPPRP
jgi:nucleoside phosphorylase